MDVSRLGMLQPPSHCNFKKIILFFYCLKCFVCLLFPIVTFAWVGDEGAVAKPGLHREQPLREIKFGSGSALDRGGAIGWGLRRSGLAQGE